MESLKPLFEEVARARGRLVISLYFEPRYYSNKKDMQVEQRRLKQQMEKYHHRGIARRQVNLEKTQLVLDAPEHVEQILQDISGNYRGMVYDVFLADETGKPYGRAWAVYDFLREIDELEGLCDFYNEIAASRLVPRRLRQKLAHAVREAGTAELKKRGLEDKVAEWESIAR